LNTGLQIRQLNISGNKDMERENKGTRDKAKERQRKTGKESDEEK
jgi:hypothetical protein